MSDEPQDPKLFEPHSEPTPDAEDISASGQRLPEEQLPNSPPQSTEASRAEMGEPESRSVQPQKRDSGGLLRRLSGSLRRLTGSLGNTGVLGATGQLSEEPSEPETSPEPEMDAQRPSGVAEIPQPEWESEPEDEEAADVLPEIPFEPLEDLPPMRRVTGPLSDSGLTGDTGSLFPPPSLPVESPRWADEIREESGEQFGGRPVEPFGPHSPGEDVEGSRDALEGSGGQRRLTGPLGNSGVLGDTGSLQEPAQQPGDAGWMNEIRWGMEEPPEAASPEDTQETPGGWNVVSQEPAEVPDLERRLTGPLSDQEPMLDTGMLQDRGAFAAPEPPAETVDLEQRLAGLPGKQTPFADTGSFPETLPKPGEEDLERRLTGPLSERGPVIDTGMLGDTGILAEPPAPSEQPKRIFWGIEETAEPSAQAPSGAGWMANLRDEAGEPEEPSSRQEMTRQPESGVSPEPELPQPAPDWMAETRAEAAEPGQVEVQAQPETPVEPPETPIAPSPQSMSRLRRVTGSLRKIITGALGRSQSEQQEISDDLVAGRLENTLTARPKREFRPGMPVEEEPADLEKPTTGSLVRRVTGSLRRVTGSLRRTGPAREPIQPPEPPQVIPAPWQKAVEPPKQPAPSDTDWMSELRKEPEGLIEEIEPQGQTAPDWAGGVREEIALSGEEEPAAAQPVEPAGGSDLAEEPVTPPEPYISPVPPSRMSALRRVTGSLRKLITGALGRQRQTEEQEISDDLVAGRLEHTLTSGLKRDFRPGVPEETAKEPEKANTGSLIRRVTGSLRRITGSLYGTGTPKEPVVPQVQPAPWQLPPEPEKPPIGTTGDRSSEDQRSRDQQAGWQIDAPREGVEQTPLSGDEPISLLESGAIAALGETEKPAIEPDWMKSIRGETAGAEREGVGEAGKEKAGFDRMTGSLRKLITDIAGGEEQVEEPDVTQAAPGFEMEGIESSDEAPAIDRYVEEEEAYDDGMAFLDGLEARFGHFEEVELPEEEIGQLTTAQEGADSYDFLDVEEVRIWGETDQTVPPDFQETASESFWAIPTDIEPPPDLSQRIWGETIEEQIPEVSEAPKPRQLSPEEALAAQYLAGDEVELPEQEETRREYLREALQRSEEEESELSVQDLRAIALENYEEIEQDTGTSVKVRTVLAPTSSALDEGEVSPVLDEVVKAGVEDTYLIEPNWSFGSWIASHSRAEKILLIEAAVVILALLVSMPFFVARIIRGPSAQQAGTFVTRPLSGDLPYPVSLILPGGWNFSLQKSTVSDGQWKPTAGEWLEGTELRRVVALPWNPQTEAVVRTFQAGDGVELGLSNQRTLRYEVEKVERVPVSDTAIMSDPSPALVIILFEEEADSRWVVICKP
jgi:hypothetical protein